MAYLATRVGRLFVERLGSGTPVLFWHSFLCDGGMWRAQALAVAKRHRVIVVDGPSHGRSDPLKRPFSLEDCADAVVDILDAEDAPRAVLVGLSWGGFTAMRVALRAPDRVAGLALFDTSADAETRQNVLRHRAMAEIVRRLGPIAVLDDRIRSIMLAPETLRSHPDIGDEMMRRLRGWDREGIYWAARAIVIDRGSIVDDLPRISVPTLVAVGEKDAATPPGCAKRIAAGIAGAELHVIPGAGHLSSVERPAEVTALVERLLDRV
jgi:3-oxoadipate enol-lactonase